MHKRQMIRHVQKKKLKIPEIKANINRWQKEAAKEVERNRAEAEKEVENYSFLMISELNGQEKLTIRL